MAEERADRMLDKDIIEQVKNEKNIYVKNPTQIQLLAQRHAGDKAFFQHSIE